MLSTQTVSRQRVLRGFHNQNLLACYHLLSSRITPEESASADVFGIGVELFSDEFLVSHSEIHDISTDKQKVSGLLKLLSENLVTPLTLKDIVEDYLAIEY